MASDLRVNIFSMSFSYLRLYSTNGDCTDFFIHSVELWQTARRCLGMDATFIAYLTLNLKRALIDIHAIGMINTVSRSHRLSQCYIHTVDYFL